LTRHWGRPATNRIAPSTDRGRHPLLLRHVDGHAKTWHFLSAVESSRELESFLRGVGPRAFRIARLALRDDQDALDALQEAMIKLVRRYASRSPEQWAPLFYAILRNCVRDQQRGRQSRSSVLAWFVRLTNLGEREPGEPAAVDAVLPPPQELESEERLRTVLNAIADLPARQQEAFLLRNIEELDVRDTAVAMGCSEGSVKTHYSRAVHALREKLGDV
jgi:RNA polymerase sigma-70 factor (ECF subfamily)